MQNFAPFNNLKDCYALLWLPLSSLCGRDKQYSSRYNGDVSHVELIMPPTFKKSKVRG